MATDQEIRDAGFKYIPPQKYLQNPFQLPVASEEPIINQGIVNTNAFTGGGGGNDFSVYNPDPNSIVNRNYDPYDYRLAADIDEGSDESYYTRPEPTGLGKFAQFASSFIPGAGIARFIGNYLPVNRRSIMENQLGGKGVMVDNIGRIVQGEGAYDTAANVMAGYNPYHMTAATFDDRIEMATKKMTPGEYKDKRIAALKEAKQNFLDAEDESDLIYADQVKKKKLKKDNTIIGRYFKQKEQKKEDARIAKEKAAAAKSRAESARQYDPAVHGATNYGLGSDGQQSYSNMGTQGFGVAAGGYGGPVSNRTGKGRTGYFYGGLASIL
jgi:hypothetical protein